MKMAPPHQTRRADPFIQHNPITPHYKNRLPEKEWDRVKPTVTNFCAEGLAYAEIVRRLESEQIHISTSQLKTRLQKWGLRNHLPDRPLQRTQTIQDTMSTILAERHPNVHSPYQTRPSRVAQHPHVDLDTSAIDSKSDLQVDTLYDGINSLRLSQSNEEPQYTMSPDSVARWSYTPTGVAEPYDISDTSTAATNQHSRNTSDFTLGSADVPELEEDSTEIVDHSELHSVQAEPCLLALRNVSICPHVVVPPYKASDVLQGMLLCTPTETRQFVDRIPNLSHMASLLLTLRCFEHAFDAFYHLSNRLSKEANLGNSLQASLLFSVVGCARSACTKEQREIARTLVVQLRDWLWGCFPSGRLDDPRTAMYLEGLRKMAEGLGNENSEETAYWTANAVISCVPSGRPRFAEINTLTGLWPAGVLRYYHESPHVQTSFAHVLEEFMKCLHGQQRKIDVLAFGSRLPGDQIRTTQALARLILEHYVSSSDAGPRYSYKSGQVSTFSSTKERFGLFEEQALATLCFILVEWTCELYGTTTKNTPWFERRSESSDLLRQAARRAQKAIDAGPGDLRYLDFIELFFKWLVPCPQDLTQRSTTSIGLLQVTAVVSNALTWRDLLSLDISHVSRQLSNAPNNSREKIPSIAIDLQNNDEQVSLLRDSVLDPPITDSPRSSKSSAYRSFKALSAHIGNYVSALNVSPRTVSSGNRSDEMNWRFSTVTGLSSGSSVRGSAASDAAMGVTHDHYEEAHHGT